MIQYAGNSECYAPDEVLARIFKGTDPTEAEMCRAELASLGDGPEGDRLRALFERLVHFAGGNANARCGFLVWRSGCPMTPAEIAELVLWDKSTITDDLRQFVRAGLLEYVDLPAWPAAGAHPT